MRGSACGRILQFLVVAVVLGATAAGVAARPGPDVIDGLRARVLALLDWPAAFTVRLLDGEVEAVGIAYRFDLTAEKPRGRELSLTLRFQEAAGGRPGQPSDAVTLGARARRAAASAVELVVDAAGPPSALGRWWPAWLPRPAALAARGTVTVAAGGQMAGRGRITVGDATSPATIDLASSYDPGAGRLTVGRYDLAWDPGVRLEGEAGLDATGLATATARGSALGGTLTGRLAFRRADGAFESDLSLAPVDAAAAAARLGIAALPLAASAATLHARLAGTVDGPLTAGVELGGLRVGGLAVPVEALLDASARLAGTTLAGLERASLTIAHAGHPVAIVSAASRDGGLWPITIDAHAADLSRAGPLLPDHAELTGAARLSGSVAAATPLVFEGQLQADVPRATVQAGLPVTMTAARTRLPIAWGPAGRPTPGTLSVSRLSAAGLSVESIRGSPRLAGPRLTVPDLAYRHYGGHGGGWLEIALDRPEALVRARVAGEGVDLAEVVRASGTSMGEITGKVNYVIGLEYSAAHGLVAGGRVDSGEEGGEISIAALQRLIEASAVQNEATGLLRRTLQNLRVFRYASLDGELRWSQGDGRLDLTIRGKKRFWIFPAPVEAINIKNMPLSVLTRGLPRGTTP